MAEELTAQKEKVGIGAYIALILAIVFFSGIMKSTEWWGMFDYTTLNGAWGKVVQKVSLDEHGVVKAAMSNLRGKGGSGAIDGFCFAFTLVPGVMFALAMITVFEHYGALKAARVVLTPILRPLLGIPGTCGLAMIGSFQSTDGGAALTRQLRDNGLITDKEANIFAAFQLTCDAPITNFLGSGAVLFTLVGADGQPVIPISIGLGLAVIFCGKILAAQLMRLFLIRQSNKQA